MGFLKTSSSISIHVKHTGFLVAGEGRALAEERLIIPRKVSPGPKYLDIPEVEGHMTVFSIGIQRSSPSDNVHVRKDLMPYPN